MSWAGLVCQDLCASVKHNWFGGNWLSSGSQLTGVKFFHVIMITKGQQFHIINKFHFIAKWFLSTVPDRSNLTENAALNMFLKHSALHSLSITLAFLLAFPKRSSNMFPVRLHVLLYGTVHVNIY